MGISLVASCISLTVAAELAGYIGNETTTSMGGILLVRKLQFYLHDDSLRRKLMSHGRGIVIMKSPVVNSLAYMVDDILHALSNNNPNILIDIFSQPVVVVDASKHG